MSATKPFHRHPRKVSAAAGAHRQAQIHSSTRLDHASETAQDYVECIADLITETGEARLVDLAGRMGVTHVTANRTISRLLKAGFVTAQPYRSIFLTEKGKKLADECKSRHQTVVAFLRSIGVPESVAETDAEGIEHHVSPETLAAFQAALKKAGSAKHRPARDV